MLTRQNPLTPKEKAWLRRSKGVTQRWSLDQASHEIKKVRGYLAPVKSDFVPMVRGRNSCKLSHEKRLILLEKHLKRVAFFAELGVVL